MPAQTLDALILAGRGLLGLHTNTSLASFLGISRRTVQRHAGSTGLPDHIARMKFVRALYAVDPANARTVAKAYQLDIRDLEVTAAPPPAPAPLVNKDHIALLTLAAADALNMVPRDVRPALTAIFSAAVEMGVDLNELGRVLVAAKESAKKKSTSP